MRSRAEGDGMLNRKVLDGFHRAAATLALVACLAVLAACSTDDERPLVLIDVALGTYAVPAETVAIAATAGDIQVASMSVQPNVLGKYGLYLPEGTSGTVTVSVSVLGSGGCVLASGTVLGVPVTPGKKTAPVDVPLVATGDLCLGDAAVPDTAVPGEEVAAPLDTPQADVDRGTGEVAGPADAGADAPLPDAISPDTAPIDAAADQVVVIDGGLDVSVGDGAADAPFAIDAQPDSAEAGPTTMNVLRSCTTYNHSDDTGTYWGILQVVFSPDGQYLVSVGEDARLKVWSVTPTGLLPVDGLVFPGERQNPSAAFSPDGTLLAVGHGYNNDITVYDFAQSVAKGGAVTKWEIPVAVATADRVGTLQFTTDQSHLVALYYGDSMAPTNYLVVWELATTPTNMKQVTYPQGEQPYAVAPGAYPGPTYVASRMLTSVDGGDASIIAVTDITSESRVQATVAGGVDQMIFTHDGKTLVVGVDYTGEFTRWTVGDTSLIRASLPLIAGTSTDGVTNFDVALSLDGKYLGVAVDDGANSVKVLPLAQDEAAVSKVTKYYPWALGFAPSGLALAIGQASEAMVLYCTP